MEEINVLLIVMIGFLGLLLLLIGYQVKHNQSIESISLPNLAVEKIRDKAGFSRFAGSRAMWLGFSAILTAALMGLLSQFLMMIILLFSFLVAAFSLELITGYKRYL